MKIVSAESISQHKRPVDLIAELEKKSETLLETDDSEWMKWEPEKRKDTEQATIISPKVAEWAAACYIQPGAKKLKPNTTEAQKKVPVEKSASSVTTAAQKSKLPQKPQKEIVKIAPSKLPYNCAPKVCNPQSFKKLLENPNLEVQLVQPGKAPQIVRLPTTTVNKPNIPPEKAGKFNNGNKNGNGAISLQSSFQNSGVEVKKVGSAPLPGSKPQIQIQPPKLIAESFSLNNQKQLTKQLPRQPPQLLREASLNFPTPNSTTATTMRGRPGATPAARGGRGRAVAIASKPSPEKLAAKLLEQDKIIVDKKQGTYRGRGRPPKTVSAPKIGRGGASNIGKALKDDAEGTYVAPKPPPGSDPSNGKDLPPPKGLPPTRVQPKKIVTTKAEAPPSKAPAAAPAAPVKTSPTKSKVVPFPSKQPQPPSQTTKNVPAQSNESKKPLGNNPVAGKAKTAAPPPGNRKNTDIKTGAGGINKTGGTAGTTPSAPTGTSTRPAPFLTRVTETSSETNEKAKPQGDSASVAASYRCPDMDAKAFYFDNGVKFWVCLVCNKEEPEISTTPMICCDTCDDWYHFECVGIDDEPSDDEQWYCKRCMVRKQESKSATTKAKTKVATKNKAKQPLPPVKAPKNPRKV